MKNIYFTIYLIVMVLSLNYHSQAYTPPETRVTYYNRPSPGYIFLAPYLTGKLALCDKTGTPVVLKQNTGIGQEDMNMTIQDDGRMTSFNSFDRKFYAYNENIEKVDSFNCTNNIATDFHALKVLPGNHALLLGEVDSIIDMRRFIEGGYPSARVVGQIFQEIDENKNLVFQWNSFDHIPIVDATEDFDLKAPEILYIHSNAIVKDLDGNYLLCSRHLDEITKISKTTGQIIWRMGGSKCKNNQFTFINDTINGFFGFSHQHDLQVLPNGNFLILDNGNLKPTVYTRAVEYEVNEANRTVRKVWEYRHDPDIADPFMGSVQRLQNGNTVIGWGGTRKIGENNDEIIFSPLLSEVKYDGTKVFELEGKGITSYIAKTFVFRMNVDSKTISMLGLYLFDNPSYKTNFELNVLTKDKSALITVEKHNYKAKNISLPNNENLCTQYPFRWVVTYSEDMNIAGEIKFKLENIPQIILSQNLLICYRSKEGDGVFRKLETTLIPSTKELKTNFMGEGEYIICSTVLEQPVNCKPDNAFGISTDDTLHWNNVTSGETYTIELSEFNDFHQNVVTKADIIDNYFNFTGLDSGTIYYWRIRAENSSCIGKWSAINTFTTVLQKPFLIMPPNNSNNTPINAMLAWNAVKNAQSYQLIVSDNMDFNNKIYDNNTLSLTFQSLTNLNFNTRYYWKVRGISGTMPGPWSEVYTFSTKLLPPQLVTPVNNANGISIPTYFEWEPAIGAAYYLFQIATDEHFNFVVHEQSGIETANFRSDSLFNYTKYYWRVKSINQITKSDWSVVHNFKTVIGPPQPEQPKNSSMGVNIKGLLLWSAVKGAASYNIQLSKDINFDKSIIDVIRIKTLSINYDSLEYNTVYYWRVSSSDTNGTSQWSKPFSFTTLSRDYFKPPVLYSPPDKSENAPVSNIISWESTPGAVKYRVQIGNDIAFSNIIKDELIFSNSIRLEPLENFKTYYWHIIAIKDNGYSNWSDTWSFRTIIGAPMLEQPSDNITGVPIDGKLFWKPANGAESYNLQVSKNNDFLPIIIDKTSLKDTFLDYKSLEENTIYFWRVSSAGLYATSDWAIPFVFKTQDLTFVPDGINPESFSISAFPQPAVDNIQMEINSKSQMPVRIKFYNVAGVIIKDLFFNPDENTGNVLLWDVRHVINGSYFYVATCGNTRITGKIIIYK
ncbi:MAG: hypothetical protein HW421_2920 [Ignavibacteria bacterium]|nr:hypothetical protein [Ignavibacteria bacterium]